jgi:hypothetical protein
MNLFSYESIVNRIDTIILFDKTDFCCTQTKQQLQKVEKKRTIKMVKRTHRYVVFIVLLCCVFACSYMTLLWKINFKHRQHDRKYTHQKSNKNTQRNSPKNKGHKVQTVAVVEQMPNLNKVKRCADYVTKKICVDVYPHAFNTGWNNVGGLTDTMTPDYEEDEVHVQILSQLSTERIFRISELVRKEIPSMIGESGRVSLSLAVYTNDLVSDYALIKKKLYDNPDVCKGDWCKENLHLHLVYKKDFHPFPINILRNVAVLYSTANWLLLYDIDFIPSSSLKDQLSKILPNADKNNMYVVPAFGIKSECGPQQEQKNSISCTNTIPASKKDLMTSFKSGLTFQFMIDSFPNGHRFTDYPKWLKIPDVKQVPDTPLTYQVKHYVPKFYEPYVVFHRSVIVKNEPNGKICCELLFERGWNKIICLNALEKMGLKYHILTQSYAVHFAKTATLSARRLQKMPTRHRAYNQCVSNLEKKYKGGVNLRGIWKAPNNNNDVNQK